MVSALIIGLVVLALVFDFVNGFHDAANSIATVVVTRVLSPKKAILMAAFANFIGFFFFFGVAVASTIGEGIVPPAFMTLKVAAAALAGAIIWNGVTWLFGIPASSSHALVGGLVGAGLLAAGPSAVNFASVWKIAAFIVVAPLLGMLGALVMAAATFRPFRAMRRGARTRLAGFLQIVSAFFLSVSHGVNDAQKTMGLIAAMLLSEGMIANFYVPKWVELACYTMISLGTLTGGWKIIKSMGEKITRLEPLDGFCAQTGGVAVLFMTAGLGIPASTTHVISGSVMGVGVAKNAARVNWSTVREFAIAWILTIPAAAALSAATYFALGFLHLF